MLTGKLPYPTNKNHEVKAYLLKCQIKISKFKFSKPAYNLLTALLDKNPKTRLGAGGVTEVMHHEFFKGIDWPELLKKNVSPPYVPKLKGEKDCKLISRDMLEKDIESCSLDDHDVRSGNMIGKYFKDFTYTREDLDLEGSVRQSMFELD